MKVFPYFSKPVKFLIAIRTHPVVWVVMLFACACTSEPNGGPLIRIILPDLSADAIYLVMDPTGDETVPDESLRLSGPDRRGVWHIPVRQLTGKFDRPVDTLMIRYTLADRSNVVIEVFDVLGKRVNLLEQGVMEQGVYQVSFDGSSLASGIYLIRLRTGSTVLTRKIQLLK
jgi:hypothetical protein